VSLANHLEIERGFARLAACSDGGMFSGEYGSKANVSRMFSHLDGRMKFLCLQSFERFDESDQEFISRKLNDLLGLK
jgi:hypothetical protein